MLDWNLDCYSNIGSGILCGGMPTTVLTDCDLEKLKTGTEWELIIDKVKEDEEGNNVVAYKFGPA